jgi:hypothetical protein
MKKLVALFGVFALAACGGDASDTAVVEDTTVYVAPASEPAPVMDVDTTVMVVDTAPDGTMDGAVADTVAP